MANEGIQLEVYAYPDYDTLIGRLTARRSPTFLEEIGGTGGGSFLISRNDTKIKANPSLLRGRNLIRYLIDGEVIGAFILQERIATTIGAGEKKEEAYQVSGPGLKVLADDSEVRPYGGLKSNSGDSRSFSFASEVGSWYNAGDWITPVSLGLVLTKYKAYAPDKWPIDAKYAQWIWGTGSAGAVTHPAGDNYFRITVPVPTEATYKLYLAVDDYYDLYVDGARVATTDRITSNYVEAKTFTFDFTVGTHIIGIRAINKSVTGPGGVAAALYRLVDRVAPSSVGTVTISIATPATVTRTSHGLTSGTRVYLTTTGTLPAGLSPNQDYYVRDVTTNTFKLANSSGGPAIKTSGSQSGTHTVHRQEIAEREYLRTYSGVSASYLDTKLAAAEATVTTRLNTYNALPAGDADGNNTEKKQAKAKSDAKAAWQKAVQERNSIQTILNKVNHGISDGITWKVFPYPDPVPGWTPGEILLTLLDEAAARGVVSAGLFTPTFTSTEDSNGDPWLDPIDWTFPIGQSLLTVMNKMEELVCDIWIDPVNLELNVVNRRETDRTEYVLAGSDVVETPVIFRRSKNIRAASMQFRNKVKNSLSIKTEKGWLSTPEQDAPSIAEYGVLEGTLDTAASAAVSKQLAKILFAQKAMEEEGANYDIVLTDDKKVPWRDFQPGDWVLAPNEQDLLVPRRLLSISAEENASGRPHYTFEFDTIFRDNEDRTNRVIERLGGGGFGSSSANAGGVGSTSPLNPVQVEGNTPSNFSAIPQTPNDLEAFSIGTWTADGVTPQAQVNLIWEPVTADTDENEIIPDRYEVWGRLATESEDTEVMMASVTEPKAVIEPFIPDTEWTFRVIAWLNDRNSDPSPPVTIVTLAPNEPMDAPDAPTVTSELGLVTVTWNGLLGGQPPPNQFRYVYASISATELGTYVRQGAALARDGRNITLTGLTKGVTYWAKLTAVDGVGISSPASTAVSITVVGVDLGDLASDVTTAIEAAQDAADDAAAAIEVLEDFVIDVAATADGKNSIVYSNTTPSGTFAQGDLWFVTDAVNTDQVIGVKIWNGTTWVNYYLFADSIIVPGSAGSVVIADGAITATKVAAEEILGVHIGARAIDTLHLNAQSIISEHIGAEQILTEHLVAEVITSDKIKAGAIEVNHLSPAFGNELDISANEAVTIIAGRIDGVEDTALDTANNLEEMQTYYRFGTDGAEITKPGSVFALSLKNDVIEMLENGNVVSYWNSGTMYVDQIEAVSLVLGNHQIEQYGNGTVIRDL